MEQKSIVFIVVALVVGAALGAGIGWMLFGDSEDVEQTTWWLYIDYGDEADSSHKNGWYSAKATDMKEAAEKIGVSFADNGFIDSVNGVVTDSGETWSTWLYNGMYSPIYNPETSGMISSNLGLGGMYSTVSMILLCDYDPVTYVPVVNPNTDEGYTAWMGTGPLAA